MDRVSVGTVVHVPPEEAFEELLDLPQYAHHADHLRSVTVDGDGGVGTSYRLTFGWWKVEYAVTSTVTGLDRPDRIAFDLRKGITATGEWRLAPTDVPETDAATEITLVVRYDPSTVADSAVDLPGFVSMGWVIDQVAPFVEDELERIVERVVADIEGERRPVTLDIDTD